MSIEPLADRIVVRRLEPEEKTAGGIVLPETAKEKPKEGKIIAVGPGKILDSGEISKMQLKKGDRVIFASYAGTEVEVDGEELLIMSEEDVLAVVKSK